MNYKITIFNSRIYKEIVVEDKFTGLTIGTGRDCQVQLLSDEFGRDFIISVRNNEGKLEITSDGTVVFGQTMSDVGYLEIGNVLNTFDANGGKELLNIEFDADFGVVQDNYNFVINLREQSMITIGGAPDCIIRFFDREIKDGKVTLTRTGNGFIIDGSGLLYGITINGVLQKGLNVPVKNKDFIGIYGHIFYLCDDLLYTSDSLGIDTRLQAQMIESNNIHFHYPQYTRSVRQHYKIPDKGIEVLPPKSKPNPDKKSIWLVLLPTILMLSVMVGVRALVMKSNMSYVLMFAAMGLVTGVTAIVNYFYEKKKNAQKAADRITFYKDYIARKEKDIQKERADEKTIMLKMNRSVDDTMNSIRQFDGHLFSHSREEEDFLDVWIGTGAVASRQQVEFKKQEYIDIDDDMMDIPEKIHDKYEYIDGMPVVLHLREANAVGFVAERTKLYQLMKNMMVTIAGEYFFKEVKMFLIIGEHDVPDFSWARWFKNMSSNNGGMRYFMYDDDSAKRALEFLYNELSAREQVSKEVIAELPFYVVFVYRSEKIRKHPVMDYVEKASGLGFVFLFWEEQTELLDMNCSQIVFLESGEHKGYIQDVEDGKQIQAFDYPHTNRADVQNLALRLSCVYIDEMSLEETLTKHISLYKLLGIMNAYDLDLEERWNSSQIYKSMAAPLGVRGDGETVYLDIHEKYHGPHGLVAGTTGSGKSEIIQSYILSMATLFHPYEVGFIIIDFKGGGMANQFKELPHLNGAITNIDGKQIDRSLRSIKAELLRRQTLFAEMSVNKIDDYISLFKKGTAKVPLPHLILIVDEFAELKSEQPEFMKELISAARIGRSLGVHLILATQKPAGVVNDQIWSNSKFKLCLKVQDKQDSNEVIKSPLAAEIREPGRAYLQVGNNEIFELFQSAYSGDPAVVSSTENRRKFEINSVDLSGRRAVLYSQKGEKSKGEQNQLEAIVARVKDYCEEKNIAKLQDICLPPLAEVINFPSEIGFHQDKDTDITCEIGIFDDPDNQYQGVHSVNLTKENLMIIGSTQVGKTNLLQTLIRNVTTKYTSDEVNIFIIDFASMVLKNFESLKHVGGVVTSSEDEKLKNLLKLLYAELDARKEKLLSVGVSSFSAYREAGKTDLPQIILMVDNLTALREMYFNDNDELLGLCREGLAVGISVVIANTQTQGMGYKYLSNFSCRIAMFCNDTNEYSSLFEHCRERIEDIKGRCLIEVNKKYMDCQTYLAFEGEKEIDRVMAIREYIEAINGRDDNEAKKIPVIPALLTAKEVVRDYAKTVRRTFDIIIGLDYATVDPFIINLANIGVLGIGGKEGRGRHSFIKYLVRMLNVMYRDRSEVHIFDGIDKRLACLENLPNVSHYSLSSEVAVETFKEAEEELKRRYDELAAGNEDIITKSKLILIIINQTSIVEELQTNATVMAAYRNMIGKYKNMRVGIIIGGIENEAIPYSAPDMIKRVKETRHMLFFDDLANSKAIEITMVQGKPFRKKTELGDGFYLKDNAIVRLKIPFWEEQ